MSKARKTKELKYNLFDRGRKHTGVDRGNVDFTSMISLINSPAVQEMIETGSMVGFYGHQIRQRFGMTPPESTIIDGKVVHLEPAFKTISIKADKDGTVTHQEEFLDNEAGEYAKRQYAAKAGGFSTAVNYKNAGGSLTPSGFFGFDYVLQPNYSTNVGDGQLFDGLFIPEQPTGEIACFDSATNVESLTPAQAMIARMLESQIIDQYDSISEKLRLYSHAEQAHDQLAQLERQEAMKKRRAELQAQRQKDIYLGMVGETRSFDSVLAEAEQYLDMQPKANNKEKEEFKPSRLRRAFGFFS